MDQAADKAKGGLRALRHFLWPARCMLSRKPMAQDAVFTPEDFSQLTFLHGNSCALCARPFEPAFNPEPICAACLSFPPAWSAARAALIYNHQSAPIILGLKHAGRREGLNVISNWMCLAGQDLLCDADALIPVPLHYKRLVQRGFNQAAWLAQRISRQTDRPVLYDTLIRQRATPSQGGLNARQRRANVTGAFSLRPGSEKKVRDKCVLLIDDVYTTGSTLDACTHTLLKAGARQVNILVLARVVRDTDITI